MDDISDELIEEVRACIGKKNFDKCVDKKLEEHGIDQDQKPQVLEEVIKKMDSEVKKDDKESKNK